MRGAALAMAMVLGCAGPAVAAGPSFDCGKATTADEKLVCADPALAEADADLAGVYHAVLHSLRPEARSTFETSERSWLAITRLTCSSSPKLHSAKDRADCLIADYHQRAHQLFDSEQKFGLYDVLRVHAYALIELDPATSEQLDQAGPTIERETYDFIENASGFPPLAKGAKAWNVWVTPKGLLTGATTYAANPKRDTDGPVGAYRETKILDATDQVIVFERIVFDKTTLRGSDTEFYGVWLLPQARQACLSDFFRADTAWAASLAKRVNADTAKDISKPEMYEKTEPASFKISAGGLDIDSGHIDGFAPPQHITTISWADLKPFISEDGQRIIDSFHR